MGRHGVVEQSIGFTEVGTGQAKAGKIVAVGSIEAWTGQGHQLPEGDDLSFIAFHEIDEATLAVLQPRVIYSPVLAREFDCIDMALRLQEHGFTGIYRAIGDGLPRPDLIEREVRQLCPRLQFEIVVC